MKEIYKEPVPTLREFLTTRMGLTEEQESAVIKEHAAIMKPLLSTEFATPISKENKNEMD